MTLDPRLERVIAWIRRHGNALTALLTVVVLAIAGVALYELTRDIRFEDVRAALAAIAPSQIAWCLALCALSYWVLTFYDVFALRMIGKPQRYRLAALGSFTSYTFSHNLGFAPVTGAAARWRAYRGTNLNAADIARVVVIAGVTFWLGIILLLGLALVFVPGALRVHHMALDHAWQAAIGVGVLAAIGVYLRLCARRSAPLNILGWTLPVPDLRTALKQFALAAVDITVACAALLALIPQATLADLPVFLAAYVVAITVALIVHAPGGLGVFEAVMLVALPHVDRATLLSALIVYRVAYYWLPLALAIVALGVNEVRVARRRRVQLGESRPGARSAS